MELLLYSNDGDDASMLKEAVSREESRSFLALNSQRLIMKFSEVLVDKSRRSD